MNSILQTLAGSSSAPAVQQTATAFGISPAQAQAAMGVMIDALSNRLERNTLSRGGLADLVRAVGDPRNAAYAGGDLVGSAAQREGGNAILAHILGSRDASRGVAARAARAAGLPAATAEAMLPQVAAMMMGEVQKAAQGPFDDILRRIPGLDEALREIDGRRAAGGGGSVPRSGGAGDGWSDRGGGGGGFDLPDAGPAPSPRTGGMPEQQPLPIPGDVPMGGQDGGSRYDDLSDILRRGGFKLPRGEVNLPDNIPGNIPGAEGGGPLGTLIRAILGALLGFQSRGLIGWIVRLIVMRWGWGFLQRILGRILGRVVLGR